VLRPGADSVSDTVDGGSGIDWVDYSDSTQDFVLSIAGALGNGTANGADISLDTLLSIENIEAGAGNDTIVGSDQDNIIIGGGGFDFMSGGAGNDTFIIRTALEYAGDAINGGTGTLDTIRFTTLATESVVLTASVTSVEYIEVSDVNGDNSGTANSSIFAQSVGGAYTMEGNAGNNSLTGGSGANTIIGGDGNDTLRGNAGVDILNAGNGNDTLDGGTGIDTYDGGFGNDIYILDDVGEASLSTIATDAGGTDQIQAIVSIDLTSRTDIENVRLFFSGSSLTVSGLNATGNSLANTLLGNDAANTITGAAGNDILQGGGGDDRIIGGLDRDTMRGDAGADRFVWENLAQTWGPAGAIDSVTDFVSGTDKVEINASAFALTGTSYVGNVLNGSAFVIGSAATTADHRFLFDGSTLRYDADGTGATASVRIATFSGGVMTAADFFIA
jgi:serralysin